MFTDETLGYLRTLPTKWSDNIQGLCVVLHDAPLKGYMDRIYPDPDDAEDLRTDLAEAADAGAAVLIVGRTHLPFRIEGALLSCDAARQGNGDDQTLLLDLVTRKMRITPCSGGTFGVLKLPTKTFASTVQ